MTNRVGGDGQLAYVSVSLTGEMALLADGYHSSDAGLIDGDQDCAVLAGGGGEGVRKPLLGEPLSALLFTCVGVPQYASAAGGPPGAPTPVRLMTSR